MKIFKITLFAFIATLALSTSVALADNNWYFAGITFTRSESPYTSSSHKKIYESNQKFTLDSCKDKTFWSSRNLYVRVVNEGTAQMTSYHELEEKETYTFTSPFVRLQNLNYFLNMQIANPLVSSVYFSATWYLD